MRIIRAAAHRTMPWKNGGGTTTEIAVFPAGASLGDFDWRVSMAHVGGDGPFSAFPGIDRTLCVLTGGGIALAFADGETVTLKRGDPPYAFPAERALDGRLLEGPIDDLNVMSRRDGWRHQVTRLVGPGPFSLAAGSASLLVALADGWTLTAAGERSELGRQDAALPDPDAAVEARGPQGGELYAITIEPVQDLYRSG